MYRKAREIKRTASFGGLPDQSETPKSKSPTGKPKKKRAKKGKSRNKKSALNKKWSTHNKSMKQFYLSKG